MKGDVSESSHSVIAVTLPFLGGMVLMLLISLGSIHALSAMRAYVTGLAVWIGAEGNTSAEMHRILARPGDADHAVLESSISIWAGDNVARLELMKPNPDYAVAARGLLAGGNHPANIDGMMWLFRAMRLVPAWQEPLRVWAAGDQDFEKYLLLNTRIRARFAAGIPDTPGLDTWHHQIDAVHAPLVVLEHRFAEAIDDDARRLTALLLGFLALSTAVLLTAGYLAARRILKRTDEIAATLRVTERLAFEEHERATVLLRSIGDAVISTDRRGIVQFLNSAAEQLTGLNLAEACGRPLHEVFRLAHPGDAPGPLLRDAIERFMSETSGTLNMGLASELIRLDGSTTPMLALTEKVLPSVTKRSASMLRRMRSAICAATSRLQLGSTRPNSSPPSLASRSPSRSCARMVAPTRRINSSPAAWPPVSLTILNWSRSMKAAEYV